MNKNKKTFMYTVIYESSFIGFNLRDVEILLQDYQASKYPISVLSRHQSSDMVINFVAMPDKKKPHSGFRNFFITIALYKELTLSEVEEYANDVLKNSEFSKSNVLYLAQHHQEDYYTVKEYMMVNAILIRSEYPDYGVIERAFSIESEN